LIDLDIKSIINPPESTGMGFWSINPYVGCELGCSYCYARYAHRYVMERTHDTGQVSIAEFNRLGETQSWEGFERQIFVKRRRSVLAALERDLAKIHMKTNGKSHPIVIGTATDPYQPAEQRFHITRAILSRLLETRGLIISLITKSPRIWHDIELLRELHNRHRLVVYISLISTDVQVIKQFEARSPMPHARLATLRKLSAAGITAGLNAAPVLPGITDSAFQIDSLIAAASKASAAFVHPAALQFFPSVRDGYLPIVEKHFPDLVPRYQVAYRGNWDAPTDYVSAIRRRFRRAARKYGMDTDDPLQIREQRRTERDTQLSLL
jgi:DNA repair photolyase